MANWRETYDGIVRAAAEQIQERRTLDPQQLYLDYRPSTDTRYGAIAVFREDGPLSDTWQLACPEAIPAHITSTSQLTDWIKVYTDWLPMIASADSH